MSYYNTNKNIYYLPQPPREWSRVQNSCSLVNDSNDNGFVKLPYSNQLIPSPLISYKLQMLNKGNILQYKANSGNLTKAQRYSKIARGQWTNRNTTWASQSTNGITNPNTTLLKRVGSYNIALDPITGQVLGPTLLPITCPQPIINNYPSIPSTVQSSTSEPPVPPPPPPAPPSGPTVPPVPQLPQVEPIVIQDSGNLICSIQENVCTGETTNYKANQICNLTTDSDVPGRIEPLCWNDGTPTWYPRQRYIMTNSTNKWPYTSGNPKPVLNSALKLVAPVISIKEIINCNTIILEWSYSSNNCLPINNFYLYINNILFSIVPKNINTITIDDLLIGQTYSFYITAVNTNIESDKSNIINFNPTISYVATGNYTVYNNNGYTGIVFEYPSGTIQFSCSHNINILLVGGGGGGGGGVLNGGGGGGGIYLNNNFQVDTNTYNISIGNGGTGYIFFSSTNQTSGGNTIITNGITNYFANGGGISYSDSSGTYGGIGGNSSDGISTGGNGGDYFPILTNGSNSTYISTILPFTFTPTTLYLSGGGGTTDAGGNRPGFSGKGYGGISGTFTGVNGQSASQSISSGAYGGGGGSGIGGGNGGNGGNGVIIMWWKN